MAAIPITIQVYQGDTLVKTEKLTQETIKIGKISSAHINLEDESVSRLHANIELSPDNQVTIVDLTSTKGTFVNGARIGATKPHKLESGDEVKIGDVRLVVTFDAPAPVAQAAPVAAAPPPPRPAGPPLPGMRAPGPFGAPAAPPAAAAAAAPAAPVGHLSIPPAYGPKAFVPQLPPQVLEQVEVRDGSKAVEVAALFEDAVVAIRHFDDPKGGKVTGATNAMIYGGIGALTITFLLFLTNYITVSREVAIEEAWELENAAAAPDKKKEKPHKSPGSRVHDAASLILLVGGIAGLALGVLRRQKEEEENEFTIGPAPGTTFKSPGEDLPVERFPLVRSTGDQYEILLTQKMSGELQVGGKSIQVAELLGSGQAKQADVQGAFVMPIPAEGRFSLQLGDSFFNVNSVAKARTYPVPLNVDWGTQSYTGAVFGAVALFMALIFSVPPDPKSLSLDAFMNDQRFAKLVQKPPEEKPEEIPDWLKKKAEEKDDGGKKAKESEGKMGKKDTSQKNKLYNIKGPQDNKDIKLAKEAAKDAAKNAGVLGLIRSGQMGNMASIFGRDSALGKDASDAMGGLVGTEAGDAYGGGGFGLVGAGGGGGGTGEGTIGLGNIGTVGHGAGGGGGYGAKVGALKGRKAGSPEVVPGTAEVRGSLDKELIRRIIRRHINEVKFCYERELTRTPNMEGRVMVNFTIGPTGAVVASIVQSSTLGNPTVEQCIAGALRRWEFPRPQGGIVVVTYPFVLKAAGGE
ncbi:MAG: AgmX/PglI C-terminal domain-containing protein [Myxococcales bacterium]|nr:AgmX/PglI C-terminal domain-containing protein [Myxococcales bacterium]